MDRQDWEDHYEAIGEVDGYKSIYIPDDKETLESRDKIRKDMKLDAEKAIAANFKKSAAARKRHYVKMLILKAKNNKVFADMSKKKVGWYGVW